MVKLIHHPDIHLHALGFFSQWTPNTDPERFAGEG